MRLVSFPPRIVYRWHRIARGDTSHSLPNTDMFMALEKTQRFLTRCEHLPHYAVNPTRRRPGRHRRTGGPRMTNTAVTGAAFDIDGGPQLVDGGTARAGETP